MFSPLNPTYYNWLSNKSPLKKNNSINEKQSEVNSLK